MGAGGSGPSSDHRVAHPAQRLVRRLSSAAAWAVALLNAVIWIANLSGNARGVQCIRASSTRLREHLEVTAVERPEDVEVPAVQTDDRPRPIPLG